jgi:coproporphyrinogen III oxidase-like Fe-S oxidoreductase
MDKIKSTIMKVFINTEYNRFLIVCRELSIASTPQNLHDFHIEYAKLLAWLEREGCLEYNTGCYTVTTKGLLLYG